MVRAALLAAPFHLNPLAVAAWPEDDKALLAAHNRALGRERQAASDEAEQRLKRQTRQRR